MGRTFPNGVHNNVNTIYIHPLISASFFIACIAATVSIVSSLCGFTRKKSSNQSPLETKSTAPNSPNETTTPPPLQPILSDDVAQPQNDLDTTQQPLPPPPGRPRLSAAASYHCRSVSAATTSSSASNLVSSRTRSMRIMGTGLISKQGSKREDSSSSNSVQKKKEKNFKHEDSIWKKTIILGDKCRVPDEDDDTIVYDEKGKRISTYHRKNANSMALSRQGSSIDQDAIPSNMNPGQNDD